MAVTAHSAGNPARKVSVPSIKRQADSNQDAAILQAFEQWKTLHAERRALPPTGHADQELALWNRIDARDRQVRDLPATTPTGVACKLWIAITQNTPDHDPEDAAFRTDLAWFEAQGDALDWNLRCIVSALRSLKTMEA